MRKEIGIIVSNEDSTAIVDYTGMPSDSLYKKLMKLIDDYSDVYKLVKTIKGGKGEPDFLQFSVKPKKYALGLRHPVKREMSEEQKKAAGERMKKIRAKKKRRTGKVDKVNDEF